MKTKPSMLVAVVGLMSGCFDEVFLKVTADMSAEDHLPLPDFSMVERLDAAIDGMTDAEAVDLTLLDLTGACLKNNRQDGPETDTDCGGGCAPCEAGKHCLVPTDCTSGSCGQGMCGPWVQLTNVSNSILHAYAYNGAQGALRVMLPQSTERFADNALQVVTFARFINNMQEIDADNTDVNCVDDKQLGGYSPTKLSIPGLPVWGCKRK